MASLSKDCSSLHSLVLLLGTLLCLQISNHSWAAECPSAPSGRPRALPAPGQPLNSEQIVQLLDYRCFGDYDRDVESVLRNAQTYIEQRAPEVSNPAIVLDIDETSLSNWPQLLANDFKFIPQGPCALPDGPCGVRSWEQMASASAVSPALALFRAARARGVAVFFITGRPDDPNTPERRATERNLRAEGYTGWAGLILRPVSSTGTAQAYKQQEREKISHNYTIIANIGDQDSDLAGGFADRTFKVPNPFYFIP